MAPAPVRLPPPPRRQSRGWWLALTAGLLALGVLAWAEVRGGVSAALAGKLAAARPVAAQDGISSNFAIVRVLGEGGMGVVYEAVDRTLDRRVAIKKMREEMRQNPAEAAAFLKEAKIVAGLRHPNIVEIYSVVAQGGDVYLVFEFVEGKTVYDLLSERSRLSLQETKAIMTPVCQALDFAHGRMVIHRDLKPANIMVNVQGVVKVMDFGVARHVPDAAAAAGSAPVVIGTPLYMAPEAENGILCRETDIYALGAMTYEMLTGRPPFPAGATMGQKVARDYSRLSSLVPGLNPAADDLMAAALESDYRRRLHSAGEFGTRLAAL